jgi:flagellar assembly protein FliH
MLNSFEPLFGGPAPAPVPDAAATPAPHSWLGALAARPGGFAPDVRFLPVVPAAAAEEPVAEPLYDKSEVDAAYTRGMAAGRAAVEAEFAARDQARTGLSLSLARLDEALGEQLADRLAQTVMGLCQAAMAPYAIDPAMLQRRCIAAAGVVGEGIIDASLRLHPDDIDLLDRGFASTWHIEPDGALERGTLVFDMAEGAVEDGPAQWRAALAEALGTQPLSARFV